MKSELQAIADAMARCDFDTARDLSDVYVKANPTEFSDYFDMVDNSDNESEALAKVVAAVENLRSAGLAEHQLRAEAFHFYRWHPQSIGAHVGSEPTVRNDAHPTVRNG